MEKASREEIILILFNDCIENCNENTEECIEYCMEAVELATEE